MPEQLPAQFHHIGVSVADLDAQLAWYQNVLGLADVTHRQGIPEHGVRVAILQAPNGLGVELIEHSGSERLRPPANPLEELRGQGYAHWAMRVDNLEEVYERLNRDGADGIWPSDELPSPTGGLRVAFIRDPEGNTIELMEFSDG